MTSLPLPSSEAASHSQKLVRHIQQTIAEKGGWINFADYMHLALYAPGMGYYSAGSAKFGEAGDFTTAPEMTALFGRTLARQVAQVLSVTGGNVLELGAGSGKLAADVLLELEALQQLPSAYCILEVSAYLREEQQVFLRQSLPDDLYARVRWLNELPSDFIGLILGNEVLDALPVHLVQTLEDKIVERGVVQQGHGFAWEDRPLSDESVLAQIQALELPAPYLTEICPAAQGLIGSLSRMLQRGVILLLDYGFPRSEYYHPQRSQGTLMCHYRHHAHDDPFFLPGLQDITAHVDFSLIAEAAITHQAELLGYASQAQFLINCGITDLLSQVSPQDMAAYAPLAAAAQKLLSPAEMGELFKVIAISCKYAQPLLGFSQGDKSHML